MSKAQVAVVTAVGCAFAEWAWRTPEAWCARAKLRRWLGVTIDG